MIRCLFLAFAVLTTPAAAAQTCNNNDACAPGPCHKSGFCIDEQVNNTIIIFQDHTLSMILDELSGITTTRVCVHHSGVHPVVYETLHVPIAMGSVHQIEVGYMRRRPRMHTRINIAFSFSFFLFFLLPPFPLSQCVFSLADEGKECGRGKVCEQGACIVDRAPRASTQPKVSTIDNQLVIESNDGLKMIAREVEFKLGDGSEFTAGSLYRSTAESAETVADLKTVLETTLVRLLHFLFVFVGFVYTVINFKLFHTQNKFYVSRRSSPCRNIILTA